MNDSIPSQTPVERAYARLLRRSHPVHGLSDDQRGDRNDAILQDVTALARLPGETLTDIERKLAVVGTWLRTESHAATAPFGVAAVLLIDSARDDLARLAVAPADGRNDS